MRYAKYWGVLLSLILFLSPFRSAKAYHMAKAGEPQELGGGSETYVVDRRGTLWQAGNASEGGFFPVLDHVASVSGSGGHTAVIDQNGTLWTWGTNQDGQLGNGEGQYYYTHDPVRIMEDVTAVSCGGRYTAAIKTDGTLWVWGDNYLYDRLGLGCPNETGEDIRTPTQVMENVAAVSCSYDHTAALKTDGTLWMWGKNTEGQLGLGYRDYRVDHGPTLVMKDVSAVSCGGAYTAAIKTDGSLWVWGRLETVGVYEGDAVDDYGARVQTTPCKVMEDVAAVSCGSDFIAVLKSDASLWTWGARVTGQTGQGTHSMPGADPPGQIMEDVEAVYCGGSHTVVRKRDGSFWGWGSNMNGGLGFSGGNVKEPVWAQYQTVPIQLPLPRIAYPATQEVLIDGKAVTLQAYALKNAAGYLTNYVKVRDLALVLDGTAAQFNVDWKGKVEIWGKTPYTTRNGQENNAPYVGEQTYTDLLELTQVNGELIELDAFLLTDDSGGSSTYYKLRDLGQALGFRVDWSAERGVLIETGGPSPVAELK